MFTCYNTLGIPVKITDRREADRLITLYTEDFGRIDVVARGVRKISSKLRSGVGWMRLSEIEFIQGKTYKTLTGAAVRDKYTSVNGDPQRTEAAARIIGLVEAAVRDQQPDRGVWKLILSTLERMDSSPANDFRVEYHLFFWNLMALLGWKPSTSACCYCKKKLPEGNLVFIAEEGGMACPGCAPSGQGFIPVGADIAAIINLFYSGKNAVLAKLKMKNAHAARLDAMEEEYLSIRTR